MLRTPEHFLPMIYAAGGCTSHEDFESYNAFGGENWEMNTQLNSNFAFGLQREDTRFLPSTYVESDGESNLSGVTAAGENFAPLRLVTAQ
jgi:hypothetical protein